MKKKKENNNEKNDEENDIVNDDESDIEIIQFSINEVNLNNLNSVNWPGNTKNVEFFKDEYTKVTVLSIDDHIRLKKALEDLDDNHPLQLILNGFLISVQNQVIQFRYFKYVHLKEF